MDELNTLARSVAVAALTLFLSMGALADKKVYITTDEAGQPMASDVLPPGGEVQETIDVSGSSNAAPSEAQQEVERIKQNADEMAAERREREQKRASAKEAKQNQEAACAASRDRLKQLESQPPNRRLVMDSDGTAHRVTADEMDSLLKAAKQQVATDCVGVGQPAVSPQEDSPKSEERQSR